MDRIITRVLYKLCFSIIVGLLFVAESYGQDANYFYEKFKTYRISHPDTALYFAINAKDNARKDGDSLMLTKSLNAIGWLEKDVGNYSKAIENYLEAYQIAERNNYHEQVKYLSNNLGLTYTYNGDYDESLKYHLISLQIREQEEDEKEIAITRNNLGLVYQYLNHYKKALENYLIAYTYFNKVGDLERELQTAINIGGSYQGLNEYQNAHKYYSQVEEKIGKLDEYLQMQLFSGLGDVNYSLGNLDKSFEYFNKSEKLANKLESDQYLAIAHHNKAIIHFDNNDIEKAREYFQSSLESSTGSSRWMKKNYRLGANIEEVAGNYEHALEYYKEFMAIQDSLLNEAVVENVQNLQLGYAEQQHERIQSTLDMQLEQNHKINILLGALLLSVGFIAFFSYRASKARKDAVFKIGHAYQLVEKQKEQLERMVEERTIDLRHTNEELANFIYRTSHDIRGPLATLKGVCNVALLDIKDREAITYLEKIDATSSKLINILSRIQNINSIKNYITQNEEIKLKKCIDTILDDVETHEDVSVYNSIPAGIKVNTDMSMLKMCLSNVVNNAFKFRKRGNMTERPYVKISYSEGIESDIIQVVDNGAGIHPENVTKIFNLFFKSDPSGNNADSAGIGLHLAKLAIDKVGGDISAVSVPGQNTCFTISIPKNPPTEKSIVSEINSLEEEQKV